MRNKKGFTLVELLVVIAILAVLATVSVVGYTAFISKSNNSNAMTELKQAQEIILGDLITETADYSKNVDDVIFFYETGTGRVNFIVPEGYESPETFSDHVKESFTNLTQIAGTFKCKESTSGFSPDSEQLKRLKLEDGPNYIIGTITYTTSNGKGVAEWISGQLPSSAGE